MTFKPAADPKPPHGNTTGLRRHYKRGEPPCEPCLKAGREDSARRRTEKRLGLPLTRAFDDLLDVIAGECRRAGMLPDDPDGTGYEWYSELHERAL